MLDTPEDVREELGKRINLEGVTVERIDNVLSVTYRPPEGKPIELSIDVYSSHIDVMTRHRALQATVDVCARDITQLRAGKPI